MGAGVGKGLSAAIDATPDADLASVIRNLAVEERQKLATALAASATGPSDVCVKIPEHLADSGQIELTPFDFLNGGRPIPMVWFYKASSDLQLLLSSLEETLVSYPVFCGRYMEPPTAVTLNNAGVPVQIRTVSKQEMTIAEATAYLPLASGQTLPKQFHRLAHEAYLPPKEGMDPDTGSPDLPILSIKITLFPTGGTAIGVLLQHRIGDADAQITFMKNWSRVYRKLSLDPVPVHDRLAMITSLSMGDLEPGRKPDAFKVKAVPIGDGSRPVPEFAAVMPKIMGDCVCVVPLCKGQLQELVETARAGLTAEQYISGDDVVTAHLWRALASVRCTQLGLASDTDELTTCIRACNFRQRTDPPLGAGYCANGVCQVWTELSVRELLAKTPAEVALLLRAGIKAHTPEIVAARAQWLMKTRNEGSAPSLQFDQHALSFIISSWGFPWEAADFGSVPICFDHGALTPVVATIIPRPQGDGVNVYGTGQQDALEHFAGLLAQKL